MGNFPTLGTLTDAEELALALVLWKSLRCHGALDASGNPTFESVEMGEKALALADGFGVTAEFLAMLFRLKLVRVTLTPME